MRLRTGHNRLNAHMFRKMKLASSPACNCGLEDQMVERVLQMCPLLQKARQNVWPTAVQQHTKLYGSKEELEKKATFILQTGLSQCCGNREEAAATKYLTEKATIRPSSPH